MRSHIFALALLALVVGTVISPSWSARLEQLDEEEDKAATGAGQLIVVVLNGASHRIDFPGASEKVSQLRVKVAALEGRQPATMRLVFAGKQLEDERPLSYYGIQRDSRVIAVPMPALKQAESPGERPPLKQLTINTIMGDSFVLPVTDKMTVHNLKSAIELSRANLPAEQQHLSYKGLTLEDTLKLGECDLSDESEIMLTIDAKSGTGGEATGREMTEKEREELVASLVAKYNKRERRAKFYFTHDVQFARSELVQALVNERIQKLLRTKQPDQALIWMEIFQSDDLRVEFGYKFRGELDAVLANLDDGVEWVAEQARAALDIEASENNSVSSGSSSTTMTTSAPPS